MNLFGFTTSVSVRHLSALAKASGPEPAQGQVPNAHLLGGQLSSLHLDTERFSLPRVFAFALDLTAASTGKGVACFEATRLFFLLARFLMGPIGTPTHCE